MKLLATISAFLFSGIVAATPLHNIVVFGDSLSDNGNLYEFMKHQLPQSPPYFEGRFSNGPVWIEHLISSYYPADASSHLQNFAYGGAGVSEEEEDDALFTIRREVESYLISHHDIASDDSLFVVWIGANNYLGAPAESDKTLIDVNVGITHSIQRLVDKGAKHFLILNLPNLGDTPAAKEFDSIEALTNYSTQHNDMLKSSVEAFKVEHPEIEWLYFDLGTMFSKVMVDPAAYGFSNITDACTNIETTETNSSLLKMVSNVSPKTAKDACNGYLFFDLVHPTGLAHQMIAEKVRVMLDEAGVEFTK
ncbi:MAG: SGNH/GDSL hydrolase family protein [bacterium]|nr:SGNH/GDSL hydrolase family protein [bacterium]